MSLKDWSTTPANNASADAAINWAENQAPSTVNNSARAMMAVIREWYNDVEFRDFGHTVTRTGNTTFTIAADVTTTYVADRPIRCADSSTLYGYIASSSYSAPNTTVTVTLDSGNLSASLTGVALGPTPSTKSIPVQAIRYQGSTLFASSPTWSGNHTFNGNLTQTGTNTHSGTETFTGSLIHQLSDNGAGEGPSLILDRLSTTPAASDLIAALLFRGRDSAANNESYAKIIAEILDATSTSEDARLLLQTVVAGTLATRGYFGQGLVIGSPTSGDMGAGTLNCTGVYVNGTLTSGGPLLLNSGSVSSAATLDIVMTSYTGIPNKLLIANLLPANDGVDLYMRFSTDGGSSYDGSSSQYDYESSGRDSSGNNLGINANDAFIRLTPTTVGSASTAGVTADIRLRTTTSTASYPTAFFSGVGVNGSPDVFHFNGSGMRLTAQDTDAVRLLFSAGNIASGTWVLYGLPF